MTPDPFEARVADWLGDGPELAPRGLEAAAIAHAVTHPRTRRGTITRRIGAHASLVAAAAVLILLLLVTISLVAGARPVAPVTPTAVRGVERCAAGVPGVVVSTTEDGQARLTGRIEICEMTASDPRVQGALTRSLTADLFDADASAPSGSSNHYGTAELRTRDGVWTGPFVGTYLTRTAPWVDGTMTWFGLGSGMYDGLVFEATARVDGEGGSTTEGRILPLGDDAATALTWCFITSSDPATALADPTHIDVLRTCTVTSSDPRLAGTATEHRVVTQSADGETSVTSSIALTAAGGGWTGSLAGTGSWYVPGVVSGILTGDGAFEGHTLSVRIASEDGMHGVLLGEVGAP